MTHLTLVNGGRRAVEGRTTPDLMEVVREAVEDLRDLERKIDQRLVVNGRTAVHATRVKLEDSLPEKESAA